VPHRKILLPGNCCLIQNPTIEGMSRRRNQHHPVSIFRRFAGYFFAPAPAGLWKRVSITTSVLGVPIQNDIFHVHGLGNSQHLPLGLQIMNAETEPACFANRPRQKLAIQRSQGKPYQDTPYCEASGRKFLDSHQLLASCLTFLRRCAE